MFEDSLVVTVRRALLDPLPEVREAAGGAFDNLHDTIAQKALDGILPYVLQKLVSPLFLIAFSTLSLRVASNLLPIRPTLRGVLRYVKSSKQHAISNRAS